MSERRPDAPPPFEGPSAAQEALDGQTFLRVVAKMLFPFVLVFGVYVISHGELGPGGGFQGGVILAAAFILYGMIMGVDELTRRIPPWVTDTFMAIGVLLYAGTGLHNMLAGGAFLDYTMLGPDRPGDAEALGMTLVEYGVGITVCSVMVTIYTQICERDPSDVGVFTRVPTSSKSAGSKSAGSKPAGSKSAGSKSTGPQSDNSKRGGKA